MPFVYVPADTSSGLDMLTLSVAAMMVQPLAAYADEAEVVTSAADTVTTAAEKAAAAVPAAAEKAAEAAANTVEAPAWLGYVLLLSPIILYALFNVYRNQVNPRYGCVGALSLVCDSSGSSGAVTAGATQQ